MIFTLTIETALRSLERGWDRSGTQLVAYGATVFTAILVAARYLSTPMAAHPWLSGPLLVLAMVSVIYAYVRTTRQWDPKPAPAVRQPELQPELV